MKIQSIFCDGYGLFSQLLLSDIPGGLILFTGLNESGKTTLMEFLRTVLFGPPGRSNHRNEYLPLRGGNHGGRIRVVSHTHGTFLIEWNPSHWIITDPGGKKIDPPSFREILGNIDRQTYERIFAIGLADLQGLDVLKGEAVKARLLAASSGLGATSFPETLKNLDKEMLDLLKKSAQKPEINQFLIQLRDLQTAIKSLQGETKDYGILQSKLDHLKKITREKRTDEETIRSQIQHLENLEKAWEPWIRLSSAREKKVTWDFSAAFPPQGLERLENIKKESEELQGRKKTLEETEERFRKEKEFLVGFEKIISLKNDITMLTGEREKFTSSLECLPHLREKRGRTEEVLQKRLQDLGLDWTPEKLKTIDTSVQVRQQVQHLSQIQAQCEEKERAVRAYFHSQEDNRMELSRALDEKEKQFATVPPPRIPHLDTARQIRTAFQILRSFFSEKEKLDFLQAEREREETESWKTIQNLHEELRMIPGVLPVWIPIIPLVLGLVMSIFFFVSTNHGNVALISLIAGSAGAMALFIIRNHRSAQLVMQKRFEKEKKQLEQKITVLQTDLENVKLQRLRLEKAIAQKCRDALLPIPENLNQLEEQERQWELDIDCFREWDQLHKEIDAATQHLTGVQKRCENAQKSMECAHWELVQYQKTWQDWLTNHSFPTTFRPDGFETILQVVENARAIEQSLNDMEAEMEQTESYIRMIRMKISEILKKCAVPQLPVEPGVRDLEILQFLVEEAIEKKRKCDDLTNQLAVLRIEKGSLENRTIAKNDEISALFDQAGAGNEEEFRRIAMTFEEWCQCQKIIVENEQSLLVITGSLEKINDYEGELQHTDILEVQKEKEKLENELRSLQESLKNDNEEWGATNQRMSTLASDQRLGMLLLEERTLEEKIKESTKHWASLAVCRFFLDKTREKYEHERQPRVIQEANRFLQLMTGERYRLVSSLEENEIQLEDNTLRRKVETTWSSGLADQVYLAIRLGLAREFGRMSEPLPIVLDDILVKFDPIRQTSTCRVLLDLAREQQIILFSCHPETREIIFDTLQSGAYDDVPVTAYQVEDGHVTPGR